MVLPGIFALAIFISSCSKSSSGSGEPTGPYFLSYGDSIIYLRSQSTDYIVSPTQRRAGTYSGFPEGIEINESTGAINVTKSETGLRYRITHVSPSGDTTRTLVVLSGITFTDKFYRFSTGDSIAFPVYNASSFRVLPVSGSVFDDGNGANSGGCAVKTDNGRINLKATVRNGVFGTIPSNDSRRDFDILYKLNDPSDRSVNKLRVRLYYYNTMANVPADLLQLLNDRQQNGVFIGNRGSTSERTEQAAKPRPPCVIIIAN